MVAGIDQLATAARRAVRPPAHVGRIEVVEEAVGRAGLVDGPEDALLEQLAGRRDRRHEQLVVRAHEGDAGGGHRSSDLARLLDRQAQRLLAQDVHAGRRRGDDGVGVEVVGQADVDRVDHRGGQHLAVVEEDPGATGALGHRSRRAPGRCRRWPSRPRPPGREIAEQVLARDRSAADDADPDRRRSGSRVAPRWRPRSRRRPTGSAASTSVVRSSARAMFSVASVPSATWPTHCSNGDGAEAGIGSSSQRMSSPRDPALTRSVGSGVPYSRLPSVPWISTVNGERGVDEARLGDPDRPARAAHDRDRVVVDRLPGHASELGRDRLGHGAEEQPGQVQRMASQVDQRATAGFRRARRSGPAASADRRRRRVTAGRGPASPRPGDRTPGSRGWRACSRATAAAARRPA